MTVIFTVHKRSCRKVMLLHLSVSHFVQCRGCLYAGIQPPRQTPPMQTPPSGRPPRQTPPCPVHAGIDMTTPADGTLPTGMHSCSMRVNGLGLKARLVLPLSVTHFPVDVPSIGGFLFLARVVVTFFFFNLFNGVSGKYSLKTSNLRTKLLCSLQFNRISLEGCRIA